MEDAPPVGKHPPTVIDRFSCRPRRTTSPIAASSFSGAVLMENQTRLPVVLIGCSSDWMNLSMESVFEQNGYRVVRVRSGPEALKRARNKHHDVVVLDEGLEDLNGVEVCRALRDDPLFDHSTPIVIISMTYAAQKIRAAAYAAGAWEYCSHPLDFEILLLKLATFRAATQSVAANGHEALFDAASGLYTSSALKQFCAQLGARATRDHEPFACLAVSPELNGANGEIDDASAFADIAAVFRAHSRKSDVFAHVGDSRIAILAPSTDAAGARLMLARLQQELDKASKSTSVPGEFWLHAGYCAVSDFATVNVNLTEFVRRAETALDSVPAGGGEKPILGFEELPMA
jgi:PleD family two-component response regulator